MIIDAQMVEIGEVVDADICVIGAGPAGLAVVEQFLDTRFRVVVLESGGHVPDARSRTFDHGESVGYPYHRIHETRSRGIGGSSHLWDEWMRARPLDAIDFRRRDGVPLSGWPIGRDELEPHYRRAHDALGLGDYDYDSAIFDGGLADHDLAEVAFRYTNMVDYRKIESAIEHSANTLLILRSTVSGTAPDTNGSVDAVEVLGDDGRRFSVRSRVFVGAAGGLENARLLLLGGVDHPWLGRGFMEHPRVRSGYIRGPLVERIASSVVQNTSAKGTTRPALVPSESSVDEHGLLNAMVLFTPSTRAASLDELRSLSVALGALRGRPNTEESVAGHLWALLRHPIRSVIAALGSRTAVGREPVLMLSFTLEQPVRLESRVVLGSSNDDFGLPVAQLEWVVGDEERRAVRFMQDRIDAWLRDRGLGWLEGRLGTERPARVFSGEWHHLGATRMSADPAEGVVDSDLRVHGTRNLYLVGGSVFPASGHANPTLTIVALALRLADHLHAELADEPSLGPLW